jgi:hypothetical protein
LRAGGSCRVSSMAARPILGGILRGLLMVVEDDIAPPRQHHGFGLVIGSARWFRPMRPA